MKSIVWLVLHYLRSARRFFDLPTWLGVAGMAIGVASLVVTMAVVSGYESTLERGIQDAFGHLMIMKRGEGDANELLKQVKAVLPDVTTSTPFLDVESILAHKGKVSGVILEGIDPSSVSTVLHLKKRVIAGQWNFGTGQEATPLAVIGKGLAAKFHLKVGDEFRLVVPMMNQYDRSSFRPKLKKFKVEGILDMGRYDFDSRFLLCNLPVAQDFLDLKGKVSGLRVRVKDPHQTALDEYKLSEAYGYSYHVRDWVDVNHNLFEAIKIEKNVIFAVLLVLIVAASFNISSTLFVSVMRRFPDISVLKSMGATNGFVRRLFTGQGLAVGFLGVVLGVLLGLLLCQGFMWAQAHLGILPSQVYKLDHIDLDVRLGDLALIVGSSMVICFLATLVPAIMGSRLPVVEGLRYE